MTRILTAVAVSTAVLVSGPALAGDGAPEGLYATFFAGGALPATSVTIYETSYPIGITYDIDFGSGIVVGGAVGATVCSPTSTSMRAKSLRSIPTWATTRGPIPMSCRPVSA